MLLQNRSASVNRSGVHTRPCRSRQYLPCPDAVLRADRSSAGSHWRLALGLLAPRHCCGLRCRRGDFLPPLWLPQRSAPLRARPVGHPSIVGVFHLLDYEGQSYRILEVILTASIQTMAKASQPPINGHCRWLRLFVCLTPLLLVAHLTDRFALHWLTTGSNTIRCGGTHESWQRLQIDAIRWAPPSSNLNWPPRLKKVVRAAHDQNDTRLCELLLDENLCSRPPPSL
jgi:hypothetical protein